jgi:hypothetical protein
MGSEEILVSGGVAAMLGGVVGGGLKAFGVEVPLLATVKRQLLAVALGLLLIALGLLSGSGMLAPTPAQTGAARADDAGPTAPVEAPSVDDSLASEAPQGPPGAPDMLSMGFPEARRLIVAGGWSPIPQEAAPHDNPALGLRGEEVEATGFREAVSCGGTGGGACLMRYRQQGYLLAVVVVGDTLESGIVDMYEVLGCNGRNPPEGCPADDADTPRE